MSTINIITIDFESYWNSDYTLSKMSPLAYVMGGRYETISCAIKVNGAPSRVFFGHDAIAAEFAKHDIGASALLAHNMSGFDCYIAAYRFGLKPRLWLCTAAMARPIHAKTIGVSLAKLVEHYKVGVKNNAVLLATKGKYLRDFTKQELADMAVYNQEDTDQCWALYQKLRVNLSPSEIWQIDAIVRMRTEPQFELDTKLLEETLAQERANKHEALADLSEMLGDETAGFDSEEEMIEKVRAKLASALQFSNLLEARNVVVPMKPSPSDPNKRVPALAKTDEEFVLMQDHDDPVVAAAARGRLAIKSTLLETRIEKLLEAAGYAGGMLPMPIRYCGADTTWRDSGEEYNPLNFPRINPSSPKLTDSLRKSLRAPAGKRVIVADQSNIELRVNHTLWQVKTSMKLWWDSPTADLYRADAAMTHDCKPEEVTKDQRQLAKVKQLGLGFGAGADTFCRVARIMGGLDLSWRTRPATQEEIVARVNARLDGAGDWLFDRDRNGNFVVKTHYPAQEAVDDWRGRYEEIVEGWRTCQHALEHILAGREGFKLDRWGLVTTVKDGLLLQTERSHVICYPHIRRLVGDKGKTEIFYGEGRHMARIYGPKVCENIVQALARDIIMDNSIEFWKRTGLRPALRPYDELAYVVDEDKAEEYLGILQDIMRTPPTWWPELVTWSEGDIADTYGDAK